MMVLDKRPHSNINNDGPMRNREASCLYTIITDRRSVSRRNRASWYLGKLNKVVTCSEFHSDLDRRTSRSPLSQSNEPATGSPSPQPGHESADDDINLVSITSLNNSPSSAENEYYFQDHEDDERKFLVTPNTRVIFLSKSIAVSILLDLSPSVVSVSSQNGCVFLDSVFDALKRVLQLLVRSHEIPSSSPIAGTKPVVLSPKVFISVIAYSPFVVAKKNQVLVQNRQISSENINQVLVELWICLDRLTQEIHELVTNTCGLNLEFDTVKASASNCFFFPQTNSGSIIRHPGAVLEDIYELGLFASSLMPRLSRLSMLIITDGLFSSTNNLNAFRLKSIAISFVSLGSQSAFPDSCFGYTPYVDLMKFVSKTTQGTYLSHQDLLNSTYSLPKCPEIPLLANPLNKLFCWTIHSELSDDQFCNTPRAKSFTKFEPSMDPNEIDPEHATRFFSVDQPMSYLRSSIGFMGDDSLNSINNYHDWRSFKQLDRNLDADFEQVLSCLLREGYLIKSIQFKHKEQSRIVARLVLHWRHNLDLEQELTAPYWSNSDPFEINDTNHQLMMRPFNTPLYGDTYCEIIVHGSYSFLHNLYCDRRTRRRSEYRDTSYRQFRQLIDGVLQTHERLQYLSRFYRDSSLSKVPSFLMHGNSLLYEQPHTHRLTSTIENVLDETKTSEFQEYWQKISCLDTRSWKNLMHIHTLRLVLEHDQPKHKNIHCQNANGRYTHVQCRRALSAISTFIKSYASFALLEDTTYIKFIYNDDDDLREIETSATKGFIVIRINKLLPIIVVYLMFTSGILDSHRVQIVSYLENQLVNCKLRNMRQPSTVQLDNILKTKTISPSSESCCALIRSPLEKMLKVYSRNFINDYLVHNWTHGLPGSCPYTMQQAVKLATPSNENFSTSGGGRQRADTMKEHVEDNMSGDSINRYNLVFGKYLYCVRVVQTIANLPHEVVPLLVANVLSRISATLVNLRIKQGFHIAFNSSGILNLVIELGMRDPGNEEHSSCCLCQYVVFPPLATNCPRIQSVQSVLNTANIASNNNCLGSSKSGSLSGSLGNSDTRSKLQDLAARPQMRSDNGEIKITREYWIEQQYGVSAQSTAYHETLQNKRYSEVVDHLYVTDCSIFRCLLTYDLLQLLCDKISPYHDLDSYLARSETKPSPIFSPSNIAPSPAFIENRVESCDLPSTLIEGCTRDGSSKVPLIELEYKFSVTNFLDHCQQANLHVLLFKDRSAYYEPSVEELDLIFKKRTAPAGSGEQVQTSTQGSVSATNSAISKLQTRKMSMDSNELESHLGECTTESKREHRSSYQHDVGQNPSITYVNPIYSPSLGHMFLETLHKRLKQMHDKELKLSDYDRKKLPAYLKQRAEKGMALGEEIEDDDNVFLNQSNVNDRTVRSEERTSSALDGLYNNQPRNECCDDKQEELIDWRCFLRKGNQENLMIVLVPATLSDMTKWLDFIASPLSNEAHTNTITGTKQKYDPVCPIFVFRCSSTMINDHIMSFLKSEVEVTETKPTNSNREMFQESDLSLHFGQPCKYMGNLKTYNDELNAEIISLTRYGASTISDEKTLEAVHFRAFLRKIKNTVLKSRFSSLNDAYLSELFIHKDDILYYINNVDMDTQKKYHVSSQLKSLAEFIKSFEEYNDSLPKKPGKPYDRLLNSILLQKCGLFINQPMARFNELNPLMKQLHDKKLLFFMRCNYKIELPILEESLAGSELLREFLKTRPTSGDAAGSTNLGHPGSFVTNSSNALSSSISEHQGMSQQTSFQSGLLATSLGRSEGNRLIEMKSGSVGTCRGSPIATFSDRPKLSQAPRFGSNSTISSFTSVVNESFILEAFRGGRNLSIEEIPASYLSSNNTSVRHEAHLAEVLRRTDEQKESHHYRRVLKSGGNYNQSHSAIDQALKRVDSLGRLEHFCLTPLLFHPSWRSRLAPVRDHTIQSNDGENHYESLMNRRESPPVLSPGSGSQQQDSDDRWHHLVCNNYIKEYEQYIQTLGFNSVQIRYQSSSGAKGSSSGQGGQMSSSPSGGTGIGAMGMATENNKSTNMRSAGSRSSQKPDSVGYRFLKSATNLGKDSGISTLNSSMLSSATNLTSGSSNYNTGYLIKFLNSGCLVFKVGFCKPYVYSILYSIEGERFNNSNMKVNMAAFLDELDNIKVTMHLHSFTYDYHLRSMYSYISGRQLTFSPGYHLISFLDDFRKYYQKAPNYARNHILCGEVSVTDIKVSGQQLYNYIITHNQAYNMEVLEMSSSISNLISSLTSRTLMVDDMNKHQMNPRQKILEASFNGAKESLGAAANQQQQSAVGIADVPLPARSHANDYVLIGLKREKVRYTDGKDSDIFDCGLLITHDVQHTNHIVGNSKNCLTLKYFLILTNQRDLYPKLVHTYEKVISLGCHRPIRLGLNENLNSRKFASQKKPASDVQSDQEEIQSSELLSSGEISGPQSIISVAHSTQSSNSGLQFGPTENPKKLAARAPTKASSQVPEIHASVMPPEEATDALQPSTDGSLDLDHLKSDKSNTPTADVVDGSNSSHVALGSSVETTGNLSGAGYGGANSPAIKRKRKDSSESESRKNIIGQERKICDEEITYLGYFSSDEMDMLKFLQEKTANLRLHIEKIVKQAEVHFRRDYLWHKLMQRTSVSAKTEELPLTNDELVQLLSIVEAIDLSSLDPQLSNFTNLHINWYLKLIKAFGDLKQSTQNLHRIYSLRASKHLLLYIDPNCTTAFVLLTIDNERGSVELNMLMKDKQDCRKTSGESGVNAGKSTENAANRHSLANQCQPAFELDQDCQQLINDFINYCAAFMWSTLLA